jgi:hypothetical protein
LETASALACAFAEESPHSAGSLRLPAWQEMLAFQFLPGDQLSRECAWSICECKWKSQLKSVDFTEHGALSREFYVAKRNSSLFLTMSDE